MRGPTASRISRAVGLGLAGLLLAGCSDPTTRAGGTSVPIELTVAVPAGSLGYHPAMERFVESVPEMSQGGIRLAVKLDWAQYSPGHEAQIVRDIQAGRADLGLADAQGFDQLGLAGFRVLHAPLLVDSHELQQQLVSTGLYGELATDVDGLGVAALAVIPGPFLKPVGVDHAFTHPADFAGSTFQLKATTTAAPTAEALGFKLSTAVGPHRDELIDQGILDGFQFTPHGYLLNHFQNRARSMTMNVNMGPAATVLIANQDVLASLTEQQRTWLQDAADAAAAHASDTAGLEKAAAEKLCAAGVEFENASPRDLASLRDAVEPVYQLLREDPEAAAYLARVERLRADIPSDASGPATCDEVASPAP